MPEIRITVRGKNKPFLVISKAKRGTEIFTEPRSLGMMSEGWSRKRVELSTINGQVKTRKSRWQSFLEGFSESAKAEQMGEAPSYVLFTADEDNQKVSFKSHYECGSVLELDLEEVGSILAQRGSFFAAFMGVGTDIVMLEDIRVAKYSRIGEFVQKLYPRETLYVGTEKVPQKCFLEVPGDIEEVSLYEGESILAAPGTFLCMTENINISLESEKDIELREFEEMDYLIKFTAPGSRGSRKVVGKVWFKSSEDFKRNLKHE